MQPLNPSEISDIIRQRIESLDVHAEAQNEGVIVGVSDGIVRIHGLADAQYGEMIEFPGGLYGMALNLERDSVGAVILGDYLNLSEGMTARCTGRILEGVELDRDDPDPHGMTWWNGALYYCDAGIAPGHKDNLSKHGGAICRIEL